MSLFCKPAVGGNDGDVYINGAWLEVVFKSRIPTNEPTLFDPALIREAKRALLGGGKEPRRFGYYWRQGRRAPAETAPIPATTTVFVSGTGPTKVSGVVIENPADVAQCLIEHYGAGSVADGALTFGSFSQARAILSSPATRMSLIVDKESHIAETMGEIARQSMSIIDQQIDDNGELVYRMFADNYDPANEDPARHYRSDLELDGLPYKFNLDDILSEQFNAYCSDLSKLSSNITVRYGCHIPSGSWSGEWRRTTSLIRAG